MCGCRLCPRDCGADRSIRAGFCGVTDRIRVAKIMLHKFEEPVISGTRGSGAIFFSGCALRCCYCQNRSISQQLRGEDISYETLKERAAYLIEMGAHNLNFVTPTHYADVICRLITDLKPEIPTVYNCGGYEKVETLRNLRGKIDVYLPDYKYFERKSAEAYSGAANYPEIVRSAIAEMLAQQPQVIMKDGLIRKGVIIRHLVLPGHRKESMRILDDIAENMKGAYVSVMSQYTPEYNVSCYRNLARKITSFEYDSVIAHAQALGLLGFMQMRTSASAAFTPNFSGDG